ncbi:MAG: TonB family protein [Bacteroidales bacterium]|nr:TonB family protein [Bacteroidales bacterium]
MEQFFIYLLQSALVLSVLYIPFQLLLRKEHFFALNRAILLSIMALSLIMPFMHHTLPASIVAWIQPQIQPEARQVVQFGDLQLQEGTLVFENAQIVSETSWLEAHWLHILMAVWLIGTLVFLFWQICGIVRLYRILHNPAHVTEKLADGTTLILPSQSIPSFSWMKSMVISVEDYAENGDTIVAHEKAHIAHYHSFDRILLISVMSLQWWNPFVWMLSDALSQVHEYQADQAVLQHGVNASQYQLLLIRKAAGPAGLALVNGFKRNKLKLRIVMMNNMINLRGAKCRYLAMVPTLFLAFVLTAKAEANDAVNTPQPDENTVALQSDTVVTMCEVMPRFPGGENALMEFVQNNMKYPEEAVAKKIQGRIVLSFIIEKDGSVSQVTPMKKDYDPLLQAEAIRVVESMPKWEPGKTNGEPVRLKFVMPVTFKLPGAPAANQEAKKAVRWLVVVDGVVLPEEEADNVLKPSNIESMEIKKDEATIGKYIKDHPRAKNGVMFITTKK